MTDVEERMFMVESLIRLDIINDKSMQDYASGDYLYI